MVFLVVPEGVVDGANRDFAVSVDFVPNTVCVWINGQLKQRTFADGWAELGPRTVRMNTAPEVGDVIQILYRSA